MLWGCSAPRRHGPFTAAEAASEAQDWPRAAELWHAAFLEEDPKTPRPALETARALFKTGDHESACAMLEQGLQLFPYDVSLLEAKGNLLERCGYQRAAEGTFSRLAAVAPDRVSALKALARLRLSLGLERAAGEPLEHLVEIGRADAVVFEQLAEVQLVRGRPLEALEGYARAIELGSEDPITLLRAAQLARDPEVGGRFDGARVRALDWATRLTAAYPQYTEAHFVRGQLLMDLGRVEEAQAALRRAVETDPSHLQALVLLVHLCAEAGESASARELAGRALALDPSREVRADLERLVAQLD